MATSTATELLMTRTRARLVRDFVWYGSLALRLKIVETAAEKTAMTNGVELRYNPEWFSQFADDERLTILAHEVLHCAFLHMTRRGTRDVNRWNRACDYVINLILKDAGFRMPEKALLDERFRGLGAEAAYAMLDDEENPPAPPKSSDDASEDGSSGDGSSDDAQGQPGQTSGKSSGKGAQDGGDPSEDGQGDADGDADGDSDLGGVEDAPKGQAAGEDDAADRETEASGQGNKPRDIETDWKVAVEQATMIGNKAGTLPAGTERVVNELRQPAVDWRDVVRPYITTSGDYSWARPNRRYIGTGLYLPGTVKTNLSTMVIALDTSGSIHQRMIDMFNNEMREVFEITERPRTIIVLSVDARVQQAEEVEGIVELSRPKGGGGTLFQPAFDWVREAGHEPDLFLYLTDLDSSDEPVDPGYPVVWLTPAYVTRNGKFGETVRMIES